MSENVGHKLRYSGDIQWCSICGREDDELRLYGGYCPGYELPKAPPDRNEIVKPLTEKPDKQLLNYFTVAEELSAILEKVGITSWTLEKKGGVLTIRGSGIIEE